MTISRSTSEGGLGIMPAEIMTARLLLLLVLLNATGSDAFFYDCIFRIFDCDTEDEEDTESTTAPMNITSTMLSPTESTVLSSTVNGKIESTITSVSATSPLPPPTEPTPPLSIVTQRVENVSVITNDDDLPFISDSTIAGLATTNRNRPEVTTKNFSSASDVNYLQDSLATMNSSQLNDSQKRAIISNTLDSASGLLTASGMTVSTGEWFALLDTVASHSNIADKSVAKKFLNVATALLDFVYQQNSESENSVIRSTAIKVEQYAVAVTKSLLIDADVGEMVTANYSAADVIVCKSQGAEDCRLDTDYAQFRLEVQADYITYVVYKDPQEFSSIVGSGVASVTGLDDESRKLASGVLFSLKHIQVPFGNVTAQCSFIDEETNEWSTAGCRALHTNGEETACFCEHTTNFAILFMHSDIEITSTDQYWFNIITYIGCGISITALLTTMTIFAALQLHRSQRIVLLWHLSFCLCVAQLILVAGTNAQVNTPECKAIAVLLHFFFMSSFSWMLMEGIQLYFKSVRAVKGGYNFKVVLVSGWLIPILVVTVSLAVAFDGYGSETGCWLSIQNGLVWAFIGPAVGFIVANAVLLSFVIRSFLGLKSILKSSEMEKTKRATKAIACIMPLLGITWIFGLLAVDASTKWFLYAFCIFNSLQGLAIFVLHCARNHEVKRAFMKKYRRSFLTVGPYSPSSVSDTSGKSNSTYMSSVSTITSQGVPKIAKW